MTVADRYPQLVSAIRGDFPLRGFRAGQLNSGNFRKIGGAATANYCHIKFMMHAIIASLLFFLARPFWESVPPEKWTEQQIESVLHNSPWVQTVGPDPAIQVYLATASPIELAESEVRARSKKPVPMLDPDYLDYVRDHRDEAFVLCIPYTSMNGLNDAKENRRMQEESSMKIGKKSYKMIGHFPPTPTDLVLRLVFPRAVKVTDKTVDFDLYVPGVPFPERTATFFVKDLVLHDKLEM